MLSVLRHYLPIRKALLIVSETAILTLCLATWLSAHLWSPTDDVQKLLLRGIPALTAHDAILRCVTTSFFLALRVFRLTLRRAHAAPVAPAVGEEPAPA